MEFDPKQNLLMKEVRLASDKLSKEYMFRVPTPEELKESHRLQSLTGNSQNLGP